MMKARYCLIPAAVALGLIGTTRAGAYPLAIPLPPSAIPAPPPNPSIPTLLGAWHDGPCLLLPPGIAPFEAVSDTITFRQDGTFTQDINKATGRLEKTGTYTVAGNRLTLSYLIGPVKPLAYEFSRKGDLLLLQRAGCGQGRGADAVAGAEPRRLLTPQTPKRLVVAVTGASGALYAVRFLRQAARHYDDIYVMLSDNAVAVFNTETGGVLTRPYSAQAYLGDDLPYDNIHFLSSKDYFTPPASGSFIHDGMVVIPCSMGTLGRIATGISNDLTTRAADVCLKERRKLILVARDTPLNLIHLRNMVAVTEAGAIVLPAVPAFYHQPKTIEDLVDTVVARVLQNLGVPQDIQPQWAVEED